MPRCISCGNFSRILYECINTKHNVPIFVCSKCKYEKRYNSDKINEQIKEIKDDFEDLLMWKNRIDEY